MKRSVVGLALAGFSVLMPGAASAQSADQKAAAEVLFNDAMASMKKGDFAGACPKLEQSLAIDYAVGALARLAECHEKLGRTASAWAEYKEVASRAQQLGQLDRQRLAEQRASALEPKLSRLSVDAREVATVAGVQVSRNGEPLPTALWGTNIPVDPGEQTLEVKAPGYETSTLRVVVASGPGATKARLAALARSVTHAPTQVAAPTAALPTPLEPAPSSDGGGGSTQATIGYVGAAAGVVGLGVGVAFYLKRGSKLAERDSACPAAPEGACPSEPARLTYEARQEEATNAMSVSTVCLISGAVLAVGGGVLILTAPRKQSALASLRIAPAAWDTGGGIWTEGRF